VRSERQANCVLPFGEIDAPCLTELRQTTMVRRQMKSAWTEVRSERRTDRFRVAASLIAMTLGFGLLASPDRGVAEAPLEAESTKALGGPAARPEPVAPLESPAPVDIAPVAPGGLFESVEPPAIPVEELVGSRTASSDTWRNSDGSLTVTTYALPHYFESAAGGGFEPIDTTLVEVGPDAATRTPSDVDESLPAAAPDVAAVGSARLESAANSWKVSFGASDSPDGMQVFELPDGPISFTPVGANMSEPAANGSSVTYTSLWAATDAVYAVTSMSGSSCGLLLRHLDSILTWLARSHG